MKKRIILIISFIFILMMLTGCSLKIDMTMEQKDIVAEYIAGSLVKHSYLYEGKYDDLKETFSDEEYNSEEETEIPTNEPEIEKETPVIDPTDSPDVSGPDGETEKETSDGKWHVSEALGLSSLEIEYISYEITKEYPNNDESLFSFEAEEGYTFVVLNFKLINSLSKDVTINNSDLKPAVKIYINDNAPIYNYSNLMFNDITNLKDVTINANSTWEGIIVFMVEENVAYDIMNMSVKYDDVEYEIK